MKEQPNPHRKREIKMNSWYRGYQKLGWFGWELKKGGLSLCGWGGGSVNIKHSFGIDSIAIVLGRH